MAETRTSIYIQNDVYDILSDFTSRENTTISGFSRWAITKALIPEILNRYKSVVDEYNGRTYGGKFVISESKDGVFKLLNDNTEDLVLIDISGYDVSTFVSMDSLAEHLDALCSSSNGYYIGLE